MMFEHVRAMATAAATLIQDDTIAYKLLLDEFTGSETNYTGLCCYLEQSRSSLCDTLFDYILIYFNRSKEAIQAVNTLKTREVKSELIRRFLENTYSKNISIMVNRPTIVEAIRDFLRKENKAKNASKVNSNRISVVIQKYCDWFEQNSAISFERFNSFEKYTVSAFKSFFYLYHKKDIWEILNETDAVKISLDYNIISNTVEESKTYSDSLYIRDYIRNIRSANIELFEHHGHEDNFGQFVFELYYAIIIQLCKPVTDSLNEKLKDKPYHIKFIDMKDMSESTSEIPTAPYLFDTEYVRSKERSQNKFEDLLVWQDNQRSRTTKVKNAKGILDIVMPFVKSHQLSVNQLSLIRTNCFGGSYCKLDSKKSLFNLNDMGEAFSLLDGDSQKAIDNIDKVDQILIGIISAYSMMVGLEQRGIDVIDTYRGEVFLDPELTRYLDYESSLKYIDIIKEMQLAKTKPPMDDGSQLLRTFDDMVYHYVGSQNNGKTEFRLARAEVCNNGFNEYTRIKTDSKKTQGRKKKLTLYEQMNRMFKAMDYFPVRTADCNSLGFGRSLERSDFTSSKFTSMDCNYFLTSREDGKDYLNNFQLGGAYNTWNISNIQLRSCDLYYITESGETMTYQTIYDPYSLEYVPINVNEYTSYNNSDIYGVIYDYTVATQYNELQLNSLYASPTETAVKDFDWVISNNGYSLDFLSGFKNLYSDEIIDSIPVEGVDRFEIPHLKEFMVEYGVLSELQFYIKELLGDIIARSVIVLSNSNTEHFHSDVVEAYNSIVKGVTKGVFDVNSVSFVIKDLVESWNRRTTEVSHIRDTTIGELQEFNYNKSVDPSNAEYYEYMYNRSASILDNINADLEYPPSIELILFLNGDDSKLCNIPLYDKILLPILENKNIGERFISLLNLVSIHTKLWKVLRDAYQLIVGIGNRREMVAFMCELDFKLRISDTLNNFSNCISNVVLSEQSTNTESKLEVNQYVNLFTTMHNNLIKLLINKIQTNAETFAILVNYTVTSSEMYSKLTEFGNTFDMLGHYNHNLSVSKFIRNSEKDSAGFLMRFGKYLIAEVDNVKYYIHRTGRILRIKNDGALVAKNFNFNEDGNNDSILYRNIFEDVMKVGA